MIDIDERYKKDWEFLKDNFSKEMEYYDKNIGTKENFNKIIEEVKKVKNFRVVLDNFYSDKDKILGLTHFVTDSAEISFCFYDFYGIDGRVNMSDYLKGINYNLDLWVTYDTIPFDELEAAYKDIKKIKKIIDKVIGVGKNE